MRDAGRGCLPDPARKAHWIAMTSNPSGDGFTRGFDQVPPEAYEPDPAKAALFRGMAAAAEDQAAILAKDLKPVPAFAPSLRSRITAFLIRTFGPRAMKPVLSASKVRGV